MSEQTTAILHLSGIEWQTDGERVELPTTLQLDWWGDIPIRGQDDEDLDAIVNKHLSDAYGWLVEDYQWRFETV